MAVLCPSCLARVCYRFLPLPALDMAIAMDPRVDMAAFPTEIHALAAACPLAKGEVVP